MSEQGNLLQTVNNQRVTIANLQLSLEEAIERSNRSTARFSELVVGPHYKSVILNILCFLDMLLAANLCYLILNYQKWTDLINL
jgi:hypothetical protein